MKLKYKVLLITDCVVNLLLGLIMLLFPIGIIDFLGLPQTNTNFYPSITKVTNYFQMIQFMNRLKIQIKC